MAWRRPPVALSTGTGEGARVPGGVDIVLLLSGEWEVRRIGDEGSEGEGQCRVRVVVKLYVRWQAREKTSTIWQHFTYPDNGETFMLISVGHKVRYRTQRP